MKDAAAKPPGLLRFLPIAVIAAAAAAVFLTGAHKYLSLDSLRENHAALETLVEKRLLFALLAFAAAYVVVTALSLPGGALMSLVGGLLFGPFLGTAVVMLAATAGAAIIFTAARTAVGDSLRRRAGPFVKRMEDGFRSNAFSYLLILRLVPAFPFFVVNIAPALFDVKLRTFILATFIGIAPGTFAFVSAGNGLGAVLESGGEIKLTGLLTQPAVLTPIVALSVLAMLPVLMKSRGRMSESKKESRRDDSN